MPKKKPKVATHRIPYDMWVNSQLSVVRHYGSCKLNGKHYELDFEGLEPNEHGKFYPDLVTYE